MSVRVESATYLLRGASLSQFSTSNWYSPAASVGYSGRLRLLVQPLVLRRHERPARKHSSQALKVVRPGLVVIPITYLHAF